MELPEAQEFLYPVNFTEHPDYYTIVGYPVAVTTIHNRLEEDHYRSIESVLWEIRQLEINARVMKSSDICTSNWYLSRWKFCTLELPGPIKTIYISNRQNWLEVTSNPVSVDLPFGTLFQQKLKISHRFIFSKTDLGNIFLIITS